MNPVNAPEGPKRDAHGPRVTSIPRVLSRAAYYPEDMALYQLELGERAPRRSVTSTAAPGVPSAPRFQMLVVVPTHACNLACRYCYVQAQGRGGPQAEGRAPTDLMSDRTVCRALDLLRHTRRPRVSLFGGEPMLAWGKVRWVVERAEAVLRNPRLHMTTNATLITDERAAFLEAHGFSLIVSLDGPPEVHDEDRVDAGGAGTYQRVVDALRVVAGHERLARHTMLRATYRPGEPPEQFVSRLEHLNDLCDEGLAIGASVEPATGCSGACAGAGPVGGYAKGEILKIMDAGARWAVDRARAGLRVSWAHLGKSIHRLMAREMAWTECGAGRGALCVAPDGTLSACHHEGYTIGNVRRGARAGACVVWADNRLTARDRCARCWARHVCGGGCRMEGWYLSGKPEPGPVSCSLGKARAVTAIKVAAALADDPDAMARVWRPREHSARLPDESAADAGRRRCG